MNLPTRRRMLGFTSAFLTSLSFAQGQSNDHKSRKLLTSMIFDVRTFGAAGDGKQVDSYAINNAIAEAAAKGGGTVFFPPGDYISFSVRLQSYVNLYLSPGARIIAADSPLPDEMTGYRGGVYNPAEPNSNEKYQDYGHNHWHNSLIWGEGIHDFGIYGPGLIWGRGLANSRNHTNLGYRFVAEQAGVGNKAVALKNCFNVTLRDFSILKGGHFGMLLTGVDNLTCENLKIDTDRDGMDIDCCQNVRISRCTVNSPWDDGICLKSSFALGYARPTKNVTISDCYVTGTYALGSVLDGTWRNFKNEEIGKYEVGVTRTGRIKCGTESNGGFLNIAITNCVFEGCQGYALESVDGASIEDITISNTVMRNCVKAPLFTRLGARLNGPRPTTRIGNIARISISNVESSNSEGIFCSVLSGLPGHLIEDVRLSNIYIHNIGGDSSLGGMERPENESGYPEPDMFASTPACGFYLRHMRNVELSHIQVYPPASDPRPIIVAEDVDRLDIFNLGGRSAQKMPLVYLDQVQDLRVGWTRGIGDMHLNSATSHFLP